MKKVLLAFTNHVIHDRIPILAITAPVPTILLGIVVFLMTLTRVPLDHKVGGVARVDGIAAAAFLSTIGIYQIVGYSCLSANFHGINARQSALLTILVGSTGAVSFPLLIYCLHLTSSAASLEQVLHDLFITESYKVQGNIRR